MEAFLIVLFVLLLVVKLAAGFAGLSWLLVCLPIIILLGLWLLSLLVIAAAGVATGLSR